MTHKQKAVSQTLEYITNIIMELDDMQELNRCLRNALNKLYDAGYDKSEMGHRKLDNSRFRHGELR